MNDPSWEWDAYCDAQERAYKYRIAGETCFRCAKCEEPDEPYKGKLGWCRECECFVYENEGPEDIECGCFE